MTVEKDPSTELIAAAATPSATAAPLKLPVLPLKGTVIFPLQGMPLVVGRPASVAAVQAALSTEDKTLVVVAQRDPEVEAPGLAEVYDIGTKAVIKRMIPAEGGLQIIVQGIERVRLTPVDSNADSAAGVDSDSAAPDVVVPPAPGTPANQATRAAEDATAGEATAVSAISNASPTPLLAMAEPLERPDDWDAESEALHREILKLASDILESVNPEARAALSSMIEQVDVPLHQVYLLSALLSLETEKEQQLLEANSLKEALELTHGHLSHEYNVIQVRQKIADKTQSELSKEQREYTLRKQLAAIQAELGEQSPEQADIEELRKKIKEVDLPEEIRTEVDRELQRLERLPASSPDYQMTRSYMELVSELPWKETTQDKLDLKHAREILDADHHGLEKIKERIIEHLAVLKLNPDAKAPILCFVGPPGVGKTSLGQSIARAIGRKFERLSLGGLSDESELRGHRRTYIGAMPGRIIQAVRNAKVRNPLIMLDEIDKLGRDFRGDPSSALLEILDPAQNSTFRDNYLNLPFDLSGVMFIATANSLDTIPGPLLDRMELIRLSGYSDMEKLGIASKYLVPRRMKETGLAEGQLAFSDEAIKKIIRHYTREAGVRQLEREIGSVCRKVATKVAVEEKAPSHIEESDVATLLGPEHFSDETARRQLQPGVAAGMAWTPVGGDVLYIEAVALPDSKELTLTGQLGDVMKESAKTAQSFIRSQWAELNIDKQALSSGLHLHVPAGATPKDGPSAGVTIACALASLYTYLPIQDDVAMTGEITLTGLVLPVGGIKEKVLAAHRAGMRTIILPAKNEKDIVDLPESVRDELSIHCVGHVIEALKIAIPKLASRLEHSMSI